MEDFKEELTQFMSQEKSYDISEYIRGYLKVNPTSTYQDVHLLILDAISMLERRCQKQDREITALKDEVYTMKQIAKYNLGGQE